MFVQNAHLKAHRFSLWTGPHGLARVATILRWKSALLSFRAGVRGRRTAKVDRRNTIEARCCSALVLQEAEREVDAFDLTEPPFVHRSPSTDQEVGLELLEPGKHLWVDMKHRVWAT